MNGEGQYNPTSLIPFCEFGGSMDAMGIRVENFSVPVCNSFRATLLNDQICYETNLNDYKKGQNPDNIFQLGFSLLIDYNEDRHLFFTQEKTMNKSRSLLTVDNTEENFIIVESLGTK